MTSKQTKSKVRSPLLDEDEVGPPRTLSERAYRIIRAAILECRIPPTAIIDERALMKQHGLGRTPVREALLRLSGERLVIFKARQVIQVAPIGPTDIRDLYELRLHSERLAARLMLERATPEFVDKLSHCFDAAPALLEQARLGQAKLEEVIALDFRFHSLLYEGSGNVFVTEMLRNLFGHSYRLWLLTNTGDVEEMRAIVRSHDPILDAIRTRDAKRLDAEITKHIIDAYDRVVGILRGTVIDGLGGLQPLALTRPKQSDETVMG
jgi:DNA-binding GntR family transcriptional regulator